MSYYATDEEIGGAWFDGESVPGTNTISTSRNTVLKTLANNKINAVTRTASNHTDTYGELKDIFLRLYKQGLDGEPMALTEDEENLIIDRFGGTGDGGVPVIIHDPTEYDLDENIT